MAQGLLALIREAACIGCTKCIDACPVDAILGSKNQMHTVIADECIGCKLCLPPCPVDCIDLVPLPAGQPRIPPEHIKARYQARKKRLDKTQAHPTVEHDQRNNYIKAALSRVNDKKRKI